MIEVWVRIHGSTVARMPLEVVMGRGACRIPTVSNVADDGPSRDRAKLTHSRQMGVIDISL